MNVQIGERGSLDFGTEDPSVSVVDFQFIPINPFLEIPKEPSSNQKEVLMAILSDRSISIQTILGRSILKFPIDDVWMKDHDDEIISTAVPPVAGDPFISLLTKKGNLLILHYDIV